MDFKLFLESKEEIPDYEGFHGLPPVRPGCVRLYSGIRNKKAIPLIRKEGLRPALETGMAPLENAPVVFFYNAPNYSFGDDVVVVDLPIEEYAEDLSGSGYNFDRIGEKQEVRVWGSVPKKHIIGIVHKPIFKKGDKVIGTYGDGSGKFTATIAGPGGSGFDKDPHAYPTEDRRVAHVMWHNLRRAKPNGNSI